MINLGFSVPLLGTLWWSQLTDHLLKNAKHSQMSDFSYSSPPQVNIHLHLKTNTKPNHDLHAEGVPDGFLSGWCCRDVVWENQGLPTFHTSSPCSLPTLIHAAALSWFLPMLVSSRCSVQGRQRSPSQTTFYVSFQLSPDRQLD